MIESGGIGNHRFRLASAASLLPHHPRDLGDHPVRRFLVFVALGQDDQHVRRLLRWIHDRGVVVDAGYVTCLVRDRCAFGQVGRIADVAIGRPFRAWVLLCRLPGAAAPGCSTAAPAGIMERTSSIPPGDRSIPPSLDRCRRGDGPLPHSSDRSPGSLARSPGGFYFHPRPSPVFNALGDRSATPVLHFGPSGKRERSPDIAVGAPTGGSVGSVRKVLQKGWAMEAPP